MKLETLQQIQEMDDFRILRFFNHLNSSLSARLQENSDEMLDTVPEELLNMKEMQVVLKLEEEYETPLEQKKAAEFARQALELMASNEDTEPAMSDALASFQDIEMAAGAILALGGAVSFIVILTTHKISYKKGKGWELIGRNPGEIKEVTELVKSLFAGIPDAVLKLLKG